MLLLPPFTLPRENEVKIVVGDALAMMRMVPSDSVHCVVTSPPYWGLRDYGVDGQLGLEATPDEYVANMVTVFREVRRVLRPEGNCFLNIGDSHMNDKNLALVPFSLTLSLRDTGWFVRQVNVWSKTNPNPFSGNDRTTTSHEFVLHLSKSPQYWYNAEAIAEPLAESSIRRYKLANQRTTVSNGNGFESGSPIAHENSLSAGYKSGQGAIQSRFNGPDHLVVGGKKPTRNKWSVWTFPNANYPGAHFATFPEELPEICIKCGCPENGIVLDPFGGAGTTGLVALRLNRRALLIELSEDYAALARKRIYNDAPLFNVVAVA